jgi:hypothetical protein
VPDLPGENSRLARIGVMLLNGYGYNWYRAENRMRTDDLLIRSRASEHLEKAVAHLRDLEAGYRRKFLPPPTRQRPDPDPQHLAVVRQFRAVADRLLEVDTRMRSGAAPADDKIWRRHRSETDTLRLLCECDAVLVGAAKELADLVAGLPAEAGLDAASELRIEEQLGELTKALTRRNEVLAAIL